MLEAANNSDLPAIPSKRYFTIGEVSELCAVKPHVLRYWEQEFPHLKPLKRRGNRRYYQRHDVLVIRKIRSLLYEEGYTIGGARQQLTTDQANGVGENTDAVAAHSDKEPVPTNTVHINRELISDTRKELEEILAILDA